MKLFRILIIVVLVVFVGGLLTGVSGWIMLRGTPSWYKPDKLSADEKRVAATSAEAMLNRMTNWAGAAHARRLQTLSATAGGTTTQGTEVLAHDPSVPFQIQFTASELNAFFDKWSSVNNRRVLMDQYVDQPRIVLREGQIILAGTVKDLGTVVSMQFEPKIDAENNLQMNLTRVTGGVLPLPDSLWSSKREKVERMLRQCLAEYQPAATMATDGTANSAAASAEWSKLLLATLNYESSDPVVFIPYDIAHANRSVPAKITGITVEQDKLTMTVEQMKANEREALMTRLRTPYGTATANRE